MTYPQYFEDNQFCLGVVYFSIMLYYVVEMWNSLPKNDIVTFEIVVPLCKSEISLMMNYSISKKLKR